MMRRFAAYNAYQMMRAVFRRFLDVWLSISATPFRRHYLDFAEIYFGGLGFWRCR